MSIHPSYFRSLHQGEPAWLLGNGPSLLEWRKEDFASGITIGINKSWKGREANEHGPAHPGIKGTDYHCFVSGSNVDELMAGLVLVERCVFLPMDLRFAMYRKENRYRGHWCALPRRGSATPSGPFRTDIERGFDANFAGYMACQIAAYMGCNPILLVGYDCKDREGHHWDEDPRVGIITRHQMVDWMYLMHEWERARKDTHVINCCPDSAIPWFPKMGKDEVREWLNVERIPTSCGPRANVLG